MFSREGKNPLQFQQKKNRTFLDITADVTNSETILCWHDFCSVHFTDGCFRI